MNLSGHVMSDAGQKKFSIYWPRSIFLKGGGSLAKIQNLRTGMSRVDSTRLSVARVQRDHQDHSDQPPTKRYPLSNSDLLRGGPPCKDLNSSLGCTMQSGHFLHG